MALAADRQFTKQGQGRHYQRPVDGGSIIYYGALIGLNAAGYVIPAADAAACVVIGFAEEHVDNSAGADGAKSVKYVTGVTVEIPQDGSIGQADMNAFVDHDGSVSDYGASTNKNFVGPVVKLTSAAKVEVHVDEAVIAAYYAANQYSDANDST